MNEENLRFLGLLALACAIFDPPPGEEDGPAGPGCPRRGTHRVSRREDGALWCHECDEAFFPRAAEWDSALRAGPAGAPTEREYGRAGEEGVV